MTHFLWVEDFKASETNRDENIVSSTVKLVFGSVLDEKELRERLHEEDEYDAQEFLEEKGILLKLNLLQALAFIRNPDELSKIDFVVLDVDMPLCRDGQNDDGNYLHSLIEQYESADELRKIAGYQIYTELVMELGFPKAHILFCSNHASYFDKLKGKFKSANIKLPLSSNPDKPFLTKDDDADIKKWLNDAHRDYFVLRRGIIEGCQELKKLKAKLRFDKFSKDDKKPALLDADDYLDVLENFLPLREPGNKASLYKLFIRTLAHEWEESVEPKKIDDDQTTLAFSWIMKMSRNWLAHSKVFEQLTDQDVAYLFIVNMRAMFDLGDNLLPYEKHLLSLFTDVISTEKMQDRIGNSPKKRDYKTPKGRDIPLVENYAALLKKTGNTWQAINFHDALNNLQKNKNKATESEFLIKGLYQTFWFLTSSGGVYIPPNDEQIKDFSTLNYQFKHFDYQKPEYLFELARHIYSSSFS